MQNTKTMFRNNEGLKSNFYEKMKDVNFSDVVASLDVSHDILFKHTSKIEDSSLELSHCKNCTGLSNCKNELKGYCYLPKKDNFDIAFNYVPCRYKEKDIKNNAYKDNLSLFNMPLKIKEAKMRDISIDDKSRVDAIMFADNYFKNYGSKDLKGLYLYGNFGTGKTYLVSALFNELAKKGVKSAIVYYPDFLRELKSSFQNKSEEDNSFADKYNYIKNIPLLLLDDIGAENVTAWGRDEILGTILQYRMNEELPTFFTSNLSLSELESHLSLANNKEDKVKARRIIERIRCLCECIEIIGKNRR